MKCQAHMNSSNKELLEYETFFKNSALTHMGAEQVQTSQWLTSDGTLRGEVMSNDLPLAD